VSTIETDHRSDAAADLAQSSRAMVTAISSARAELDAGADQLTVSRLYLAVAGDAADWPLLLLRSADVGPAASAELRSLTDMTRNQIAAAVAGTGTLPAAALASEALVVADAASADLSAQMIDAGIVLGALVLAGLAGWFGRARSGRGGAVSAERAPSAPVPGDVASASVPEAEPALAPVLPAPAAPADAGPESGTDAATARAAARRDLTLLNRQLVTLDRLEQSEQDPAVLSELFELDNLTVRLRRGAESLLVLAGGEHGRRSREAAAMTDVLRAAASQIEQYDRVQIDLEHDPALHGGHVVAAAHLLAELLENATAFSEPGTSVEVTGACDAEAMTVRVVDQGIGLSDEDLVAVRARLGAARGLTDGRIGLHVVSRLAERLGAQVWIERGAGGVGTVAEVRLPRQLFAEQQTDVPVLRTSRDERDESESVLVAVPTAAQLAAAAPAGPGFEPTFAVAASGATVTQPATELPRRPIAAEQPSFEALVNGTAEMDLASAGRRAMRVTGSVVVPDDELMAPTWTPVTTQPAAGARAHSAHLGAGTGATFVPQVASGAVASSAPASAGTFMPAAAPVSAGTFVPAAAPVGGGTFAPAAASGTEASFLPAAAQTSEAAFTPALPPVADGTFMPATAPAGGDATFLPAGAPAGGPTGSSAPLSSRAPAAFEPSPAAHEVAVAAGRAGVAPVGLDTVFTPANPFADGGSASGDAEAGRRAAAQKRAMAELSGLTAYRPAQAGSGAALPARTPGEVEPSTESSTASLDRDAEGLRRRLAAFRSGTDQGRAETTSAR
jgi:anti-sigma regulatory factor (Ser/Thr protein kinase)